MMKMPFRTIITSVLLFAGLAGPLAAQSNLRPGDKLLISISGVPADEQNQVNREYTVDENGQVSLPYIPNISAAGRSSGEVAKAIEAAYRGNEIYSNPTITIGQQLGNRFVDVSGQVRAPQRVPFTEDLTLMSAISACGGATPYARENRIQLLRAEGGSTTHDLKKIRRGQEKDPTLRPGDKIIIDETWF